MRILALDVGEKTCGFALSDPLQITAQGKENFVFPNSNWTILINHIKTYLKNYKIEKIIVGYPTYPSGDKSLTTLMIEEFVDILKKQVEQPIIFVDENYTTKKAHDAMLKANLSREKRKKYKDQIAAQLILQEYLFNI